MDFGSRIRAARRAAGLSQEELARRAGMSLKGMGDIERGDIDDPHLSSLSKIAKGLGTSIGELLDEPSYPKAPAPTSSANPLSSEERQQSVAAASLSAEEIDARTQKIQQAVAAASLSAEEIDARTQKIKKLMASPSFWAAREKIEGWHFGSDAVESYIEHRVKAYEEELEDRHSPHF